MWLKGGDSHFLRTSAHFCTPTPIQSQPIEKGGRFL